MAPLCLVHCQPERCRNGCRSVWKWNGTVRAYVIIICAVHLLEIGPRGRENKSLDTCPSGIFRCKAIMCHWENGNSYASTNYSTFVECNAVYTQTSLKGNCMLYSLSCLSKITETAQCTTENVNYWKISRLKVQVFTWLKWITIEIKGWITTNWALQVWNAYWGHFQYWVFVSRIIF